jgi:16S rRNA (guanine527-N7)-methyltransferase
MDNVLAWDDLGRLFAGEVDGAAIGRLQQHWALVEGNETAGRLTAVAAEEAVRRQYGESLELLRIAEGALGGGGAIRYADIGTGGGWPGLVAACTRPGWEVHLVEPLQKRARFLAAAARELGLANVTVHAVRAEEAGRGPLREACRLVTARAVAELRVVLEYAAPLAAIGGVIALPKGSRLGEELAAAEAAVAELGCELEGITAMRAEVSETVLVVLFRKRSACPARYPRRAGLPERRPIGGPVRREGAIGADC